MSALLTGRGGSCRHGLSPATGREYNHAAAVSPRRVPAAARSGEAGMARHKAGDEVAEALYRWLVSNPKRNLTILLGVMLAVLVVSCVRHNEPIDVVLG